MTPPKQEAYILRAVTINPNPAERVLKAEHLENISKLPPSTDIPPFQNGKPTSKQRVNILKPFGLLGTHTD